MDIDPITGNWYRHLDKGESFQVVDVDEAAGNVEIQYFDGAVDKVDLDDWYELEIEPMEAPEDWTGPVDDIVRDDLGYTETGMGSRDWSEPTADVVPKQAEEETEEESEGATDEWGEERPPADERTEEGE